MIQKYYKDRRGIHKVPIMIVWEGKNYCDNCGGEWRLGKKKNWIGRIIF